MPEKKKKDKKDIKVRKRDLKPQKDAKGGGLALQSPGSRSSTSTSPNFASRAW